MPDSQRIESAGRPAKCPMCGHSPVAEILYGLPLFSPELNEEIKAGLVTLGGCCVSDDDPEWRCGTCGVLIYRRRR